MIKSDRHKKLCNLLNDIYVKKNNDYGDSFHKTFVEEGMAMPRIRLGDKFERFKNLSRSSDRQMVGDESIRDTLLDLANYAIMTILEMDDLGAEDFSLHKTNTSVPMETTTIAWKEKN